MTTIQNAGFYQKKDPNKLAAASAVPNINAQSNAISSMANGNTLTNQLLSGKTPQADWQKTLSNVQSYTNTLPKTSGVPFTSAPIGQSIAPKTAGTQTQTPVVPPVTTNTQTKHIIPTTNSDGSFTDSLGNYHAANSPEALNNKSMGTNTPAPVVTPPKSAFETYTGNTATAAGTAADTGNKNYQSANDALTNSLAQNQVYADRAKAIADNANRQISDVGQQGALGAGGYLTGMTTSPVAQGNAAIAQQTAAARQSAIASGANMALSGNAQGLTAQNQLQSGYNQAGTMGLTSQGQGITGLGTAANLSQPIQVPYSNQIINPLTGQPINGGGTGTLPQAATDYINSLADQVKTGKMTRADAESRISTYSQPGLQALNTALGSGFNTNASNASAGTTATGQQVQTSAKATNDALDTLGTIFSTLPGIQTGGIPLTNSIANAVSNAFGQSALSKYQTALADARSQLIGVLNASGGTPTGNEATALKYLPDNMTVGQFNELVGTPQNPGTARQLVQQKVSAFTQSGGQGGSQNTGTNTSGGGWGSLGD